MAETTFVPTGLAAAVAKPAPAAQPLPFTKLSNEMVGSIVTEMTTGAGVPSPKPAEQGVVTAAVQALASGQPPAPAPSPETVAAPAQTSAQVPVPPAPPAAPQPPDPKSMTWSQIHAAHAKMAEERKAFLAERQKFEAERGRPQAPAAPDIRSQLASRPVETLRQMGMDLNTILKAAIAEQGGNPAVGIPAAPASAQQPVNEWKQEVEALRNQIQQMQFETQKQRYTGQVSNLLKSPEFELLTSLGNVEELAWHNAAKYAELSGGQVLTPEQNLGMLLSECKENLKAQVSNPALQKYLAGLLTPGAAAPQSPAPAVPPTTFNAGPTTLTNSMAAGGPALPGDKELSLEELAGMIDKDFWKVRG
jgi:hypothetical protein